MSRHIDRDLVATIREMGCEITHHKRGKHLRVTFKGVYVGPISTSPSDVRSSLNTLSSIRRNIRELEEKGVR